MKGFFARTPDLRDLAAELVGTFILVFLGTGSIIVNDFSHGRIGVAGIGLTFGFAVGAMIYVFGPISGAHINPAVTFTFWLAKRFPSNQVIPYIFSQCVGAMMASLALHQIFSSHPTLGATIPRGTSSESFILEFFLTFILLLSIFFASKKLNSTRMAPALIIGAVVGFEATFAGPISGASMNPARSIGPAVVSGHSHHLWIYLAAPLLGGLGALLLWTGIFKCWPYFRQTSDSPIL